MIEFIKFHIIKLIEINGKVSTNDDFRITEKTIPITNIVRNMLNVSHKGPRNDLRYL